MAKSSGLGAQLFVGGYDLSGDINAVDRIGCPTAHLDVTAINASGHERIFGQYDGALEFTSFFNDAAAAEHAVLKAKQSGADVNMAYFQGSAIGNMAAFLTAKQPNYDGTRAQDGSFTFKVNAAANNYGLDYGEMLTAGKRTDTSATNGSSHNYGAATANGLVAHLHVFSFTGTSVTVKIQQSSDNGGGDAFADLITFTAATGITSERKVTASLTTAVEQYLRVVTTGTFSSAVFAVCASRFAYVL